MWCCSSSAKFLLDSIIGVGGGGEPVVTMGNSDGSAGSSGSGSGGSGSNISLDNGYIGNEVVVVKNGLRICGKGGALGSAPLVQTKSYWEVKVQQDGGWGVGVGTRNALLEGPQPLGSDPDSWSLRNTGQLYFNSMTIGKLDQKIEEGDVIGVSFDHIELSFYVNGVKGGISFGNVRGTVYPALYVEEGAVLDVIFDKFAHTPPPGFDKIMKEKSLL